MGNQYQTVVVRPKISSTDEDPVAKALAHFKMSKFAGCADNFIGAAYDRKLGRYLRKRVFRARTWCRFKTY